MTADEALKVASGLTWLAEQLGQLPERRKEALMAQLVCTMANMVVTEFAHHLSHGVEPYEALLKAARGELELPEEAAVMFRILMAKPKE